MNIGLELVADPSAIFLDEPTSGLDSTSAEVVLAALKHMAELGATVVTVSMLVGFKKRFARKKHISMTSLCV